MVIGIHCHTFLFFVSRFSHVVAQRAQFSSGFLKRHIENIDERFPEQPNKQTNKSERPQKTKNSTKILTRNRKDTRKKRRRKQKSVRIHYYIL